MTPDSMCVAFDDLVDYWTGELAEAEAARVEEHVFACGSCADRLADIAACGKGIAAAVRGSRVQVVITESVLNALQRAGVRIRSYTLAPGQTVPCAVWPDDQLVVGRLRGDFTGFERVTLAVAMNDQEMARAHDVPVPGGPGEILDAIPAERLRQLPSCQLRLTLSGTRGGREEVIGTYSLEHSATP
jgi:Putative zinc-finger